MVIALTVGMLGTVLCEHLEGNRNENAIRRHHRRHLALRKTAPRQVAPPSRQCCASLNLVLALALLALTAQVASILRQSSAPARARTPARLAVGDTVRFLNGATEDGKRTQIALASSQRMATVVYAFHPECLQGDAVAPEWAERFDAPISSEVWKIAVSQARPAVAAAYVKKAGWQVDVISMAQLELAAQDRVLAARTPWVFVFDSAGVLRHHGHGNDLGAVRRALRGLAQRRSPNLEQ